MPTKRRSPSYKAAIAWIAFNDEPSETDPAALADLVSVALVADVFGWHPETVAADVLAHREKVSP